MKRFKGIGASQGIAIGRLAFFERMKTAFSPIEPVLAEDADRERQRLEEALLQAHCTLEELRKRVLRQVGPEEAMILEVQQMLLDDEDMRQEAFALIEYGRCTAEYAVQTVGRRAVEQISSIEDDYLRERRADVTDLMNRMQRILRGEETEYPTELGGQFVMAAPDLLPSTMVQIDPEKVLAVVCRDCSEVSHAAIIARTMGIPAVLRIGREQYSLLSQYDTVVVDGFRGELIVDPDERTLTHYRQLRQQYLDNREGLKRLRGLPSRTADGVEVVISADVGRLGDLKAAVANDAREIGLFRCQLFSVSGMMQKEQEQFEVYREMLKEMGYKQRVAVRTIDFIEESERWLSVTPALKAGESGRAIQKELCADSLFAVQLRALLRAASYGRLAVVFPMIISGEQVEAAHVMLEACAQELAERGVPCGRVEIGIMIETPSAALIADQLVWLADFFLIDTDDLTRYIMMEDRAGDTGAIHNPRHPAVTRAIRMVAEAAARRNIRCGVCGRAATDPDWVEDFLAIGIDEFVVPPSQVLRIREKVREIDLSRRRWIERL